MTEVEKEIDKKLNDVFQIRTKAILENDHNLKLELLANLLFLYDDSWNLDKEGGRLVVGHNIYSMQTSPDMVNKPIVSKKLRKWLKLAELGHLVSDGASLVENKNKFGRLVTGLMDRLEHKLGVEGVRARVRMVASSQGKMKGKENTKSPRLQDTNRVSNVNKDKPPLQISNRFLNENHANEDDLAAEIVPPPTGKQLPRTPVAPPADFIPRGKQIPRTPPSGSICDVSRNSSDTDSDARVSSFYSPSPAVRTRGPTRANVKIGLEDFDTPTTTFVNDNKKTDKMSPVLSKPIAHSPIVTEKDLEAPGKFVSRDMLTRTPLCPPPLSSTSALTPTQDISFPPPPTSEELVVHKNDSNRMTPDLPPPPPELQVDAEYCLDEVDKDVEEVHDTPDIRISHKLPSGRQLARTPAVKEQVLIPDEALPSGNYLVPESLQNIAFDQKQTNMENVPHLELVEKQNKAEEVRKRKKEEAEFKRKKNEIENLAKEEKRKLDEEKKQLEEMRKKLLQQEKQLELKQSKLRREEENLKRKSRLSEIHVGMKANVSRKSVKGPESPKPRSKITIKDFPSPSEGVEVNDDNLEPQAQTEDYSYETSIVDENSVKTSHNLNATNIPLKTTENNSAQPNKCTKLNDKVNSPLSVKTKSPHVARSSPRISQKTLIPSNVNKVNIEVVLQSPLDSDADKAYKDISVPSMKGNIEYSQKSSLEEMRSKLKRISDENAKKQLLKEGLKSNIEKRKEGIEEILKKTEVVREQAKMRREELEKGKLKKEKVKEMLKKKVAIPDQDGSISSSSDKIEDDFELGNRLEENKCFDITIDKISLNADDCEGKTEIKKSPKEKKKITIGRKSRKTRINVHEVEVSRKEVKDEPNHRNPNCPVEDLESPTKKLKLNEKVAVRGPVVQKNLMKSLKLNSISNADDSEESPLFFAPPQEGKRKQKLEIQTVSDNIPEVQAETKSKSRRKKVLSKEAENKEDHQVEIMSQMKHSPQAVGSVIEVPTEAKSKTRRRRVSSKEDEKDLDQQVETMSQEDSSPSVVENVHEVLTEGKAKSRRRKVSSKDTGKETMSQEESSPKKGRKKSSRKPRSKKNVESDFDPKSRINQSTVSFEEPALKSSALGKRKKKTNIEKDAAEKSDHETNAKEEVSLEPELLKRTQSRKTITIRSRKSKTLNPVEDEPKNIIPSGTSKRLSSKLDNLRLVSDPIQPQEVKTKRKAPIRKEKTSSKLEDIPVVEELGTTDEKLRPRRACKKKFDTFAGMADSPFSSPALSSKESFTSEVAPKKSRTKKSKKAFAEDESNMALDKVDQEVVTEEDKHLEEVAQEKPKPRRNVGKATSKSNSVNVSKKASLKPVKDALFKTPSVTIVDEMYETPETLGVVSVVTDQEYETPKAEVKKRGRPRTKK